MSTAPLRLVNANACSPVESRIVNRLISCWEENTGFHCMPYQVRNICEWLEGGFEPEVIEMAIEQTVTAPQPAWRYLQSIMSYSRQDGAFSLDAFLRRPRRRSMRESLPL